ncbi:MAG: long-chain fatty acid--CoA ligase, partial [Gallionellaceae bacterium]|nr:long-chain fatty acid--CoA ligase [Gallionellaceae bacterium]
WLNTGDTARIGQSGHIYITGRIKEIIVMSNGEKIPPSDMEFAILRDRLFEQVMVHGEAQPFLVAMTVVNQEEWENFAQQLGVPANMPESLRDTRVEQQAMQRIAAQISEFPGYAKIRRVLLTKEPWSIENGLLTPTLKLKRTQVAAHFAEEIKKFYSGH